MSNLTRALMMGAAGASGDKTYVDDVFSTYVYTGTSSAGHVITNGIDLSGEGGAVWVKNRGATDHHLITNEAGKFLTPSSTETEFTGNTGFISSFNSNGFTLGAGVRGSNNSDGQVSWTFRKAPGFFDVVTYTGNGSVQNISHSLGSVPGMIIVKNLTTASNWETYHRSTGATKKLELNENSAAGTNSGTWNDTEPTSSVFTVGTNNSANGASYKAYIFAHDDAQYGTGGNESIIKCGTYTGSSSGVNINLGFEPQWVMVKRTNGSGSWYIMDTMRGFTASDNPVTLKPNSTDAEGGLAKYRITSTGFDWNSDSGDSGQTYIYMAIRRPNKPPEAATEVFAIDYASGSSTIPNWDSGFPIDFAIWRENPSAVNNNHASSRLTGTEYMSTNLTNAEAGAGNITWDSNVGYGKGYNTSYLSWMFKRAPGFMDVVAYTGTSSNLTVTHDGLGVAPEMMIIKNRSSNESWTVYHSGYGATKASILNTNAAANAYTPYWNDTAPTSTQFTVGTFHGVNKSANNFIALLFATLPGISKVGSYTGTGSALNIDCGFTNGARFVLIKRTDGNANWCLFDSVRGIVSGNDPFIKLNTNEAQRTDEDQIDPLSAGFTLTGVSGDTNASGGTYIFLAVA